MKLRPEIDSGYYWLHLPIIAIVVLFILQIWQGGEMLTFWNVIYSVPMLALGDIMAHSILQLD